MDLTARDLLELTYDGTIPPNALRELSMAAPLGLDRMSPAVLERDRYDALILAGQRWRMAQAFQRSARIAEGSGHQDTAEQYRAQEADSLDWMERLKAHAQACTDRLAELMNAASAQRSC